MSKLPLLCYWVLGLLSFLGAVNLSAQAPVLERLGAAEGLSQGMIFDLIQDRQGFLWFATKDGLNRYDGYSFQVFQNSPFDPFSISDNEIQALLEDQLGRIWAGTSNNGLNVLDPQTGKFYHLTNLSSQNINSLAQSSDGAIWAGTALGVNRIQIPDELPANKPNLEGLVQIDTFGWDSAPFMNAHAALNNIVDLEGSRDGKLWVSTFLQIGFFEPASGRYQKVWTIPASGSSDNISSFFQEGPDGSMWVGQPGQLLRIRGEAVEVFPFPERSVFPHTDMAFNAAGDMFVGTRKQIFKLAATQSASPTDAKFQLFYRFSEAGIMGSTRLLMDHSGLLWIGTNGYGLRKYNPGNPHFRHYLPEKSPRRLFADAQGRLWVWQAGGLFLRLLEAENQLGEPLLPSDQYIQHDAVQTSDGKIWLLCENKRGKQWQGQLIQLNPQSLKEEARFSVPISISMFSRLYAGADGHLWLLGGMSMLAKFDPVKAHFDTFDFSPTTGYSEAALSLSTDTNGHLWIGTPHGLVHGIPNAAGLKFIAHKNNPNDRQTINCNAVLASLNDPLQPDNFLWLGTKGGGLNRFDKHTGTFKHFTSAEGLPNNVVYAILPDAAGKLWLSTNCGLSKFDPKTGVFQNFFSVDGLQDNEFNTLSFAQATDGRLYFGGVNGITAFYPAELNASFSSPAVFINQLKINGLPAKVGDGVLEKNIKYTNSITLSHRQNQLTFEFVAMDFSSPRMNQFRYRLLGVAENWMESAPGENSATFTHLAPGDYVFEVITGGCRGIWDGNPARLNIRILPSWWRTGWAYALYFLFFAGGIWALYNFQVNKIRLKNKLAFEHNEALRLAELDRLKTNFFSSITHEFRTPLTLLLEPARQLLRESNADAARYRLELIEKNARRLLQFVNQLLDLSKLEAGQMPLDLRPGNPANTIRAVIEQFQPLAQQCSIHLDLEVPDDNTPVILDEMKFEQVVSNLLSNALKFTDKGGVVRVKLVESVAHLRDLQHLVEVPAKKYFKLEVSDTGIGISAEDLPNVFNRFFQSEHTRSGTGIGLSLSKELVERMGGTISVQSRVGVGTTFVVQLPCEIAQIQAGKPDRQSSPSIGEAEESLNQMLVPHVLAPAPETEYPSTPLLLLIEDDADLRKFLRASLPSAYRIAEAVDGAEGLQMANELTPDLVISDLMMPKKDGFEVAEALKGNPSTSHIPIILLTAKSALETKIEGLQRGVDAYLSKPFRADELVTHIENLLASRRRLQEHFSHAAQNIPVAKRVVIALPAAENKFLQNLIQLVDANLDNEAMDADAFARAVFISRSQLHRKISALTGLSLTEFVRNHRLDRARDMLAQGEGNIAEIAWRAGFPNAKYFSTCFKERFGVTPSGFVSGE